MLLAFLLSGETTNTEEAITDFAEESWWNSALASIGSVLAKPLERFSYLGQGLDYLMDGEIGEIEESLQIQLLDDTIITGNGLEIAFNSKHVMERKIERGVLTKDVKDALILPLDIGEIEHDSKNRPSQKFIGKRAIVLVNPEDGTIVTAWKTTKKRKEE